MRRCLAQMYAVDSNEWKIVGTGDFNGDRTSDILWQSQTDGTVGAWIMSGGVVNRWMEFDPTIQSEFGNLDLANLVASLTADGSVNRTDMIQFLRLTANNDGSVNAIELTDLSYILANYQMPDYVRVLTGNIINGNRANAIIKDRRSAI